MKGSCSCTSETSHAVTCLAGQAAVHFRSGIPHSNRTTGQATISCRRIPTSGCLEWSLSVNPNSRPVEKSIVPAEAAALAHMSYPALKGTLIGAPYRYFHMRFHEGRALDAMLQELKDRTSAKQILGLPHYKPVIKADTGDDHDERLTIPLRRHTEGHRPSPVVVAELYGLATTASAEGVLPALAGTSIRYPDHHEKAKEPPREQRTVEQRTAGSEPV